MVETPKNHIKEGVTTRIEMITNSPTKKVEITRVITGYRTSLKRSTNLGTTTSDSKMVTNSLTKREEITRVMTWDRTTPNRSTDLGTRTLDRIILVCGTHNKTTQEDTEEPLTQNIKGGGKMICDMILIVDRREP